MPGGKVGPPGCVFQGRPRNRSERMSLRETAPKLSPEKYEQNCADIAPPMNARQAAIEAAHGRRKEN